MESLATDSGKSFPDVDEDDGVGSDHRGSLTVKVGGKGRDRKQPTTPRSKHSASEQRRRSKINDRFQILKEMLPHNDHKRDTASFLLEVIEYVRFLQEKVQKYEAYPGSNQENAKLLPWNNQVPGDILSDRSHVPKPSLPTGNMYSGNLEDNNFSVAPAAFPNADNQHEAELIAGVPYKGIDNSWVPSKESVIPVPLLQELNPDRDERASQSHSHWQQAEIDTSNEQEELAIDEGTISVSSAYSQELFTTLTQSLHSSGVDLSRASVSVQIHLGKRARRRSEASTTMLKNEDQCHPLAPIQATGQQSAANQAMGQQSAGNSSEGSERAPKRHKSESN